MFATLLTITVCLYWGASQGQYVGLMRETTLQTFGRDTVFRVKIVGAFKTETRRGREWDLTTRTHELDINICIISWCYNRNAITWQERFTWNMINLLLGRNLDLHDVLRSNWYIRLSSGAKFLDIGRTVFEKVVAVVVLEIYRNPQCFCV